MVRIPKLTDLQKNCGIQKLTTALENWRVQSDVSSEPLNYKTQRNNDVLRMRTIMTITHARLSLPSAHVFAFLTRINRPATVTQTTRVC